MSLGQSLQRIATDVVKLFGGEQVATLRRYTLTGSPATGRRSKSPAQTVTDVFFTRSAENLLEVDSWASGDETLLFDSTLLTSTALDGRWTFQESGGVERRLSGLTPYRPGPVTLFYAAILRKGSGR